jgi:hypothetical protein
MQSTTENDNAPQRGVIPKGAKQNGNTERSKGKNNDLGEI